MKHNFKVTLLLVAIFFFSQIIGLIVVSKYVDYQATSASDLDSGEVQWQQLPYALERPEIEASNSYLFIIGMILIGTLLLLILIKFKVYRLWKLWYFVGALLCLSVAFSAFISQILAFVFAFILSYLKIFKPNVITHNFSELFIYGGLAAIFVPIIDLFSIVVILLLISVYDFWAVNKSKHMVKIAKFQTESKIFAGLFVPYGSVKKKSEKTFSKLKHVAHIKPVLDDSKKNSSSRNAILGGGDIGFPLLFAGVVMKNFGLLKAFILPFVVSVGLFLLLAFAKKDKFYPAMPFLTVASFIGYLIIILLP
jgi:presenilin-like A22 family membrane protease